MTNRYIRRSFFLLIIPFLCLFLTVGNAQNKSGNKRLGLHITQQELNIWKKRAQSGPYKTKGDVSLNSPGDWHYITYNAKKFLANPAAERYLGGYKGKGCVPRSGEFEPKEEGNLLRDAGFYALVTGNQQYSNAVRKELLKQAAEPLVNFSDANRWCDLGDSSPGFPITEWLTRLMFGYDYTKSTFSAAERAIMEQWFLNAGLYFQQGFDAYFVKRFANRMQGNYALTPYSTGSEANTPHDNLYYGSPQVGFFAKGYNNRMGTIARFLAIVGVLVKNESLKMAGKRYFFEWMRYGVFPNGDLADMHRGLDALKEPENGLNYAFSLAQAMADMADVLARSGDNSLYEYNTSEGYFGTQCKKGQKKNLQLVLQNTINYMNGKNMVYATNNIAQVGDTMYLVNGFDPFLRDSNRIVYDIWFALPNLYYKNADIKANYLRKAPGTKPYPAYPRGIGPNQPWGGQAKIYPGILFMFGQLEGVVNPYPKPK
ncbi:MAG: hypothetical protein V4714_00630 [Bacteroidota bacterium]